MSEEKQQNRNYMIVGLASVFLALLALFTTLLFVGLILGFCISPFIWPKIKTKLPKMDNKKDQRIKQLEAEIKALKGESK